MMRIFKSETGYSVHRYISEKRILLARNLIMSGTPSTAACLECGFKDYSSFSRAFKNQLGILPSEVKI
jgi:AraC-like DNA-binding protein